MKHTVRYSCVDLSGEWQFAWSQAAPSRELHSLEEIETEGLVFRPCAVPGNFELDLLALGEISDPMVGLNMLDVRRFESAYVWYRTSFPRPQDACDRTILRLEGVDCFASIFLNGRLIGETANMLIEHRFDITSFLKDVNELLVCLAPPPSDVDPSPDVAAGPGQLESLHVRKAPHMYGWDIMPRALSRGLWRGVSLECIYEERIEEAFLETLTLSPKNDHAHLRLHYRLSSASQGSYTLRVAGSCEDSSFEIEETVHSQTDMLDVDVPNPRLWWPRDAGKPHLYDVEISLWGDGEQLDALSFKHGIRTVQIDNSTPDGDNVGFRLVVNGEPIFVRGTNWVPLDAFHSRDLAKLPRALELLWDVGCNLVRCWGGNVYESDEFFDYCDSHGIMVWQDFAMACMVYPQDEDFQNQLAEEARSVIRRLRGHASLVLWAGDNECDISCMQGWFGTPRDPNGNLLTRKVLADAVRLHDGTRPYLPSSPYVSPEYVAGKQSHLPEDHLWGPRGYYKAPFYKDAQCSFVSEIGYHGCPSVESIRKFISDGYLWPYAGNPEWQLHATDAIPGVTQNAGRIELMASQVEMLFGSVPDSLERFVHASQACQAEAMKHFIEQFRSRKWENTGIIWWNLLDGWPQFSDAVVDYYYTKKLAYHYIKQAQSPVALMLREIDAATLHLVGVNDHLEPVDVSYSVKDRLTHAVVAEGEASLSANSAVSIGNLPISPGTQGVYAIEWQCGGKVHRNHYLYGEPPFDLDQYLSWTNDGWSE